MYVEGIVPKTLLQCCLTVVFAFVGTSSIAQNSANTRIERQSATALMGNISDPVISFAGTLEEEAIARFTLRSGSTVVINAEIDYRQQEVRVRSNAASDGKPVPISVSDLARFQRLRTLSVGRVDGSTRLGEAFFSLMNFLSEAPPGRPLLVGMPGGVQPQAFTRICGQIGRAGTGTYVLDGTTNSDPVTVGPACFAPPALGRCGAEGGPDAAVGDAQRFTQECLNHDQCCVATGTRFERRFGFRVNVCGRADGDCEPEFNAAAHGFFFAPDCGSVAGGWTDGFGHVYNLSGGGASGDTTAVAGTVSVRFCGVWNVEGTQTGQAITFTATNPAGPSVRCAASFSYTGTNTNCDSGGGTWTNSSSGSGTWTWSRGTSSSVS